MIRRFAALDLPDEAAEALLGRESERRALVGGEGGEGQGGRTSTRRTYRGAILHLQVRRASVCARAHIPLSDGVQRRVCVHVHVRSAYSLLCVLSRAWLCMPVHA
jgi:hypothetical protein